MRLSRATANVSYLLPMQHAKVLQMRIHRVSKGL